jgi:hypothetical protein
VALPLVAAAALIGAVLAPASAHSVVTIGSNLGRAADSSNDCGIQLCTLRQAVLANDYRAPGGLTSPVNGTVVGWRIRSGAFTTPVALRVIRPVAGGLAQGVGTSVSQTPPANSTTPYAASLPIAIGDSIGINCCSAQSDYFAATAGASADLWAPTLSDVQAEAPDLPFTYELLVNADIEPTSAFDLGKPKARGNGKLKIRATLPNAGTLSAQSKQLKGLTQEVSAPGEVTVTLKPKRSTRNRLEQGRGVRGKVKLSFTPDAGATTGTQTAKAKLKA